MLLSGQYFPSSVYFSLYCVGKVVYNKENYSFKEVLGLGCMKCGKKLGASQVFCDECLKMMEKRPVKPGTVVKLPNRPAAPTAKKRHHHRRYWWDAEDEIDTLRSKLRWITFALIVAIVGFLIAVSVVFLLLYWQGRLDFFTRFLPH